MTSKGLDWEKCKILFSVLEIYILWCLKNCSCPMRWWGRTWRGQKSWMLQLKSCWAEGLTWQQINLRHVGLDKVKLVCSSAEGNRCIREYLCLVENSTKEKSTSQRPREDREQLGKSQGRPWFIIIQIIFFGNLKESDEEIF